MRSFFIITIIALTGVFITHFMNQSRNELKIQQKAVYSVYQYESKAQPYGNSEIIREYSLQK